MYVSMNGTLVGGGGRLKWTEFAELASKVGYPGVDVSLDGAMKEGLPATRALLSRLKLKPAVVGLPVDFRKDDATFQDGLKKLPEAVEFSTGIGCPRMSTYIMSSSEIPKSELRKILKDRFSACGEVLAKGRMRLGLEFLGPLHIRKRFPHEFIYRMDEMVEFTKECGPNIGVLLDSWHWRHAEGTIEDIIRTGRERIVHVQLADAPAGVPPEKIVDSERLMPGEGAIDWRAFFGALKRIGYKDGVSPEVFGRGLKTMLPEDGARLGYSYTMEVMRASGVAE